MKPESPLTQLDHESADNFKHSRIFRPISAEIDHLARNGPITLMDAGCGTGQFGKIVSPNSVSNVYLYDSDPQNLFLALHNYRQGGHEIIKPLAMSHADIHEPAAGNVNVLLASFLLNQVEHPQIFFDLADYYMAQVGLLAVVIPDEAYLMSLRGGWRRKLQSRLLGVLDERPNRFRFREADYTVPIYPRSLGNYLQMFLDSGFEPTVRRVTDQDEFTPKATIIYGKPEPTQIWRYDAGVRLENRHFIHPSIVDVNIDEGMNRIKVRLLDNGDDSLEDVFLNNSPLVLSTLRRLSATGRGRVYVRVKYADGINRPELGTKIECRFYVDGIFIDRSFYTVIQ